MNQIASVAIAASLVSLPMAFVGWVIFRNRLRRRALQMRSPFTRLFLRTAGASLRKDIEKTTADFDMVITLAAGLGAYIAGVFLGRETAGAKFGLAFWLVLLVPVLFLLAYVARYITALQTDLYTRKLGLEGEIAVGEELNQLMRQGYAVFHDIPGPNYNVDHLVIGRNGVFAVETKTHPKPLGGHTAEFDGRQIRYPDKVDQESTKQALLNAKSVSRYLSRECQKRIQVEAIVVLPGWNVKQTKPTLDCMVIASGQIRSLFARVSGGSLSETEIDQLANHIDKLCRSVSPMALCIGDEQKFSNRPTL